MAVLLRWVNYTNWGSCVRKGLCLQPAQQACFSVITKHSFIVNCDQTRTQINNVNCLQHTEHCFKYTAWCVSESVMKHCMEFIISTRQCTMYITLHLEYCNMYTQHCTANTIIVCNELNYV